jgi:hypothetical protein
VHRLPKPDINQLLLVSQLRESPHFRKMLADLGDAMGASLSFDASSSKQDLMQALCDSRELLNEFLGRFV